MVSELVPGGDGSQHPSYSWVLGVEGGGEGLGQVCVAK